MPIKVWGLPARETNYIWILRDESQNKTYVVDPSVAEITDEFLKQQNWKLDAILNTHHHHDHIGGNIELKNKYLCPIYGFKGDRHRIPGITHEVDEGDLINLSGLTAKVLFIPGHTHGQIAYHFETENLLFSGDCWFNMGCGRLFEGTAEQLHHSLKRLATLPLETKVFCGHEYALQNSAFAEIYMGSHPEFKKQKQLYEEQRRLGLATVPFTIGDDLKTNPFLNTHDNNLKQILGLPKASDLEVFTALRKLKDNFNS